MPKVRRKPVAAPKNKDNAEVANIYCRKCMQTKLPTDFYMSVDKYLDSNGYMSICKDCIQDMVDRALLIEKNLDKSILSLCRVLNVKYDQDAVESVRKSLENADHEGKTLKLSFGTYMTRMSGMNRVGAGKFQSKNEQDLTFKEPVVFIQGNSLNNEDSEEGVPESLEDFWGAGLDAEDYDYLEKEKSNWEATHKFQTHAEIIVLKEVCYQQNNIRKLRLANKLTTTDVKQLQELMKLGDMSPASQNAASSGKNLEAFGMWVKDIERDGPAEFYKDKQKFKDIDGIEEYGEKYVTRCLRNFVTGSRDFNVDDISNSSEDDD